nr:TetR/AcrR family transcriptional regulator [Microlunatus panaciterrae]
MDAAVFVFAEKGILGASVEEICEQAQFTRGAFYSNFASRDELVLALLEREAKQQIARAQAAIDTILTRDPGEDYTSNTRMAMTINAFAQAQPADRSSILAQRELRLYAIRNPDITEEFLAFEERSIAEVTQVIMDALASVEREFTIPVESAIAMITALYEDSMVRSLLRPRTAESDATSFDLMTAFLETITRPLEGSDPGR